MGVNSGHLRQELVIKFDAADFPRRF